MFASSSLGYTANEIMQSMRAKQDDATEIDTTPTVELMRTLSQTAPKVDDVARVLREHGVSYLTAMSLVYIVHRTRSGDDVFDVCGMVEWARISETWRMAILGLMGGPQLASELVRMYMDQCIVHRTRRLDILHAITFMTPILDSIIHTRLSDETAQEIANYVAHRLQDISRLYRFDMLDRWINCARMCNAASVQNAAVAMASAPNGPIGSAPHWAWYHADGGVQVRAELGAFCMRYQGRDTTSADIANAFHALADPERALILGTAPESTLARHAHVIPEFRDELAQRGTTPVSPVAPGA